MDLFYHSLPGVRKQRLHFHRFMLRVHEELTALRGQTDPLEIPPTVLRPRRMCCALMSFCL